MEQFEKLILLLSSDNIILSTDNVSQVKKVRIRSLLKAL